MTARELVGESICSECGRRIPSGKTQWCEYGGFCSYYIPRYLAKVIADLAKKLAYVEAERDSARGNYS